MCDHDQYTPKDTPISVLNDSSTFMMNYRHEMKQNSTLRGIGELVNMKDWSMRNFSVGFLNSVCLLIQGYPFPFRISCFMVVDYPSWFGSIWSMMKPLLAPSFRRKVHFVKLSQLGDYMTPGFEEFLPDGISGGQRNTDQMICDFTEESRLARKQRNAWVPLLCDSVFLHIQDARQPVVMCWMFATDFNLSSNIPIRMIIIIA